MNQLALYGYFFTLFEQLLAQLSQLAPRHDLVPLSVFDAFALSVFVMVVGLEESLQNTDWSIKYPENGAWIKNAPSYSVGFIMRVRMIGLLGVSMPYAH